MSKIKDFMFTFSGGKRVILQISNMKYLKVISKFLNNLQLRKKNYFKEIAKLDSKTLLREISKKKCRGLFIDCGSNIGQGFVFFKKYYQLQNFDFILVEPNPNCVEILKSKFSKFISQSLVQVVAEAAGTNCDKKLLFGLSGESERCHKLNQGASILKNHNSNFYKPDVKNSITVDSFSLSELLFEKSKDYEFIVLKLDIEGAEYDVLDNLIKSNAINIPSYMYVEFHAKYMQGNSLTYYREKEKYFLEFFDLNDINFREWR